MSPGDDRPPDAALARLSAAAHGIVSVEEAATSGVSRRQLERRRSSAVLLPHHRGVYRHAAVPITWRGDLMAAVQACGNGAVASHRSGARLWRLRDAPLWRPEVTLCDTTKPAHRGIHVHRTDTLDEIDRTVVDGIPVTTVARTLLDLGAVVPAEVVEVAAQDAIIRGLVHPDDLLAVLDRLGKRGRRGTRALRLAVLAGLPPAGIQSRLEMKLLALIRSAGVPEPELQHKVVVDGQVYRLDFFWPSPGVAVEADGRRWHSTKRDFERDLRRTQAIVGTGVRLARFGWADVHERRDASRRAIRRLVLQADAA